MNANAKAIHEYKAESCDCELYSNLTTLRVM